MFITNNHASSHLWWKENFLTYQNDLKYYEHSCRRKISHNKDKPRTIEYKEGKEIIIRNAYQLKDTGFT